jgi:hypothetical protein
MIKTSRNTKAGLVSVLILFTVIAIAFAQDRLSNRIEQTEKQQLLALKLKFPSGGWAKVRGREGDLLRVSQNGKTFGMRAFFRDKQKGSVELRIVRINMEAGREVFQEQGVLLATMDSPEFIGIDLSFQVELLAIKNDETVNKGEITAQSGCCSETCNGEQVCSPCSSETDCACCCTGGGCCKYCT